MIARKMAIRPGPHPKQRAGLGSGLSGRRPAGGGCVGKLERPRRDHPRPDARAQRRTSPGSSRRLSRTALSASRVSEQPSALLRRRTRSPSLALPEFHAPFWPRLTQLGRERGNRSQIASRGTVACPPRPAGSLLPSHVRRPTGPTPSEQGGVLRERLVRLVPRHRLDEGRVADGPEFRAPWRGVGCMGVAEGASQRGCFAICQQAGRLGTEQRLSCPSRIGAQPCASGGITTDGSCLSSPPDWGGISRASGDGAVSNRAAVMG